MAVAQGPLLAAVLLLVSSGLHCSSPPPACPESCTCQRAPLLNCSSSGLSVVPQHIQDSVTELDLSHNLLDSVTLHRPYRNLRNVWLGNNTITHLSLCIERNLGSQSARGRQIHRLRPWSRRRCVSWAPTLQLLSVERNQLEQLPEGLEGSTSLWVLQLSFNRISTLQPGQLSHLQQLKELHLQHNLITSLHPQMFQDLAQLRVLDLSFNMLTSLHPLMYLSLSNIGADVRLGGNRWQCDCSMRSLRRRMAYDSSRGLQAWSMVCAFPSILSGKDLLQLEEDDLNCFDAENRPEFHQDVTVYSGSEILLSCSTQDPMWWTPSGQASVSQPQAGLLISDVSERDTGLYVCMSEEHEVVSVFNLQISRIGGARRKTRSLPRTSRQVIPQGTPNRIGQERNQRPTQSDLTLAVCLSVFITFLIAFILGVIARPCIDVLWRKATNKKKSPPATNSVSSVEQRQYQNEAYSTDEEPEERVTHRERRVTFNTVDFRENSNVVYYDTVASGNQEIVNNDAVIECEAAEAKGDKHTDGDSGSKKSLQETSPEDNQRGGRGLSGITAADSTHKMEFEHIPDPVELEERRSLSSCSDSSLSDGVLKKDQITQGDHTTPKSPQLAKDSIQQKADFSTSRKVEVPQISIEGRSELPGLSSEPFEDCSPHANNTNPADSYLWQENEEQFEFSDSVRSTSARSSGVFDSFNDSKQIVLPTSDRQNRDISSSSSYVSENEPTQYTVNSDQEEEEDTERNHNKSGVTKRDTRENVKPMPRTKWRGLGLGVTSFGKSLDTRAPSPPRAYSSSSSSESETEIRDLKGKNNKGVRQIKKRLDISAPLPASNSSSSDETKDETTKSTKKQEQGQVDMAGLPVDEYQSDRHDAMKPQWPALDLGPITPIKRRLDIRTQSPPTDYSSSEESADQKMDHRQKQGDMHTARPQFQESQTVSHDSDTQWPALDLDHTTSIKRRLDIKAPSLDSDSSSRSDREDQTTHLTERPGKVGIAELPLQKSQTDADPDAAWPAVDLEHLPHIKRRLDIKAPPPPPDSCSSSDSEDETINSIKKHEQGRVHISKLPIQENLAESTDPETQWPALDLEHTKRIKRRLDIKAPSPDPDSSSSSDSEDEMHNDQNVDHLHNPNARWPALDLEHIPRVSRHLDIKATSPPLDSSSSSDSEDETTGHTEKQMPGFLLKESQTASHDPDTRWPALDLGGIPRIKRRLDVKAPSPSSDSSSGSESEDEKANHINKQKQGDIQMAGFPTEVSQAKDHDPKMQWSLLDLEHIPGIKRRLDLKAPSLDSDSSSSSDHEHQTTRLTERPGKVGIAELPLQKSQTVSHDPDAMWPVIDLEHLPHIKRRLDIKAPPPPPDSCSSSDSEDETINSIKKQEQREMHTERLPVKVSPTVSHNPQTQWPAIDFEYTTRIKRRLDIKAPSTSPDSSSSSDSEDGTTNRIKKQEHGDIHMSKIPFQESQKVSHDPETQWPALNLEHVPHIKRRLDFKAPSPDSDSSTSSGSEDETVDRTVKQRPEKVAIAELQNPQTVSPEWPALDLEHIPSIKRRLDIKAPSPPFGSASSSDSEDETVHHKERPGKVDIASNDPETLWSAVDLGNITRIKRRLDIKAPSPPPDSFSGGSTNHTVGQMTEEANKMSPYSSSSSDEQEEGMEDLSNPSIAIKPDPDPKWPELGLSSSLHVKRRLDIKTHSPSTESCSSSDGSDSGTTDLHVKVDRDRTAVGITNQQPGTKLPGLNYNIPPVKRRLDIKQAPTQPVDSSESSSSDNERLSSHTIKHETDKGDVGITNHEQQTMLHELNLGIPHITRRLDIKAPSPQPDLVLSSVSVGSQQSGPNSSGSESEGENRDHIAKVGMGVSAISKAAEKEFKRSPETPVINISHNPKTDHNIKLEKYTVITDDLENKSTNDNISTTPEINPELQSRWATMNLGISRFRKRLEITSHKNVPPSLPTSPPPDSPPSSSSESGTGNKSSRTTLRRKEVWMQEIIGTDSSLTLENKPVNVSPTLMGRDNNSSNLVEVEERLRKDYSSPTTEEKSNPDTMLTGFGTPHIRRYLNIRVGEKAPATPPLQQLSDSSSSSDDEGTSTEYPGNRWRGTSQVPILTEKEAPQISTLKMGEESDSKWPNLSLTNIPRVKRALDIRAPLERESSTCSSSDDEKVDHSVPDLSLGVPLVKRRLNIKAPSPEPNDSPSSSSEENEVAGYTAKQSRQASNMSGMTDSDSQITYKRLIIKPSLPLSNSFSPSAKSQLIGHTEVATVAQEGLSHGVGNRYTSLGQSGVPRMSIDDISKRRIEQSRRTTDVDLPPEIRWTGVGHHLPDISISSPRRRLDVGLSPPRQAPPAEPELTRSDSSNSSRSKTDDMNSEKADVTLMHRYSALSASSVSLPSSRAFDRFDNSSGSTDEILRALSGNSREKKGLSALKVMSSERQKWDTEDDKLDDRRPADLLHGIPSYRRHDIGDTEPPQEAPPPVPATPLPDE